MGGTNIFSAADYKKFHETLKNNDTVFFPPEKSPLTLDEWQILEKLTSNQNVSYTHVEIGDTYEKLSLAVSRYTVDEDSDKISKAVLEIINSNKMKAFYQGVFQEPPLQIARCQSHIMKTGDFLGKHVDIESNPELVYSLIFNFSGEFQGGEFVTYNVPSAQIFKLEKFSILITKCCVAHEVKSVTDGYRKTLVAFVKR